MNWWEIESAGATKQYPTAGRGLLSPLGPGSLCRLPDYVVNFLALSGFPGNADAGVDIVLTSFTNPSRGKGVKNEVHRE